MPTFQITAPQYEISLNRVAITRAIRAAATAIIAEAGSLLSQSGDGRVYYTKFGKRQASAAPQPPASLSGRLKSSFKFTIVEHGAGADIVDTAKYALALEGGATGGGGKLRAKGKARRYKSSKNRNRSHKRGAGPGKPVTQRKMAARPYLSAAAEKMWPRLELTIGAALQDAIRGNEYG